MTALGLSNTIPEEPADVDLDTPLMNARRIASKSAIDLVGLNEGEVFDANLPLGGEFGGSGGLSFGMGESHAQAPVDNGFSFQVTMLPSRSVIVSHLSPILTDDYIRLLFQMSGDVQSIKTEYRLQGIVQVIYYDIRSAVAAKEQLNGMAVADQLLNVQFVTTPGSVGSFSEGTLVVFNIDPTLDAQQIVARFSVYGDVKRVQSIPEKEGLRLVEFYDLRHAHIAMEALNKSDLLKPSKPVALSSGLKQTMSLQQLTGGTVDSEQDEDQSSRSWDGSAQAVQQMEALMRANEPGTPSHFFQSTGAGLTKSMSIGSGLGDGRGGSDFAPDTPTSQMNRAVQLTPELAEGLRISDSASSLGSTVFPGQSAAMGLNVSPKMPLGGYGTSTMFGGFNRGLSNSSSVETGLDAYGQQPLVNPGLDAGLTQFSGHQPTSQLHQGFGMGMGSAGLNPLQGYLNTPQQNPAALMGQAGGGNLLQTIAAAQAAGFNVYDILSRLPGANLNNLSQIMAANRGGLSQTQPGPTGTSFLDNLTSANAARMAAMQNLQSSSGLASAGLSSPSYGLSGTTTGSGLDLTSSMSKSASSPALHASAEDRESTVPRFGGRLSRRNVDPVIEQARRDQQQRLYALDVEKIRRKEDKRTTLMIKNIPNKYTQKMLLASIDETLKGTYDFFYLPIDFKNKCNVGYGFINMREPEDIIPLVERFHNKKWERFNSEKICCVAYGRIQGKQALINHFQNSSLMHEDKKHRPVLFVTEGPSKGEPEAFPIGSNVRPKIALKERDFRSRERSGHWA